MIINMYNFFVISFDNHVRSHCFSNKTLAKLVTIS
ncbi:hypothetical protein NP493_1313g00025 [Ridgeia piscesae]|uniref:Uncharacterized protein n=1 Tax=Ridgeia piscesae TaxID=27915 RepID=A0AAD9K8I4_RIDPI|nr:hypothetical protein NP493_1313g00025 [Ridgeia piscesae]